MYDMSPMKLAQTVPKALRNFHHTNDDPSLTIIHLNF